MTYSRVLLHPCGSMVVVVDDCDKDILDAIPWRLDIRKHTTYAVYEQMMGSKRKKYYLHRVVLRITDNRRIDHKDGNGLNCTRSNMRIASIAQNAWNTRNRIRSTTGYIGAYPSLDKFISRIKVSGKDVYLGTYGTAVEAAKAYDRAAITYHGEFATLNFPVEYES